MSSSRPQPPSVIKINPIFFQDSETIVKVLDQLI